MGLSTLGLLFSILAYSASGTQKCVPRPIPDMVIDINRAVARGARFTDPLKVTNVEECLSACCRQQDAGGDRACNLLVFDARTAGLHNCYIFHCPTLDSCPLSSSPGVLTYSFWPDTSRPGKHKPDKEQQRPKSGDLSKAQGSPGKTSGSGDKESSSPDVNRKNSSGDVLQEELSKSITSQLLHLADKIDQHLEKMESKSEDNLRVASSASAIVPAIPTTSIPLHKEKKLPHNAKAAKVGKVKYKKPEAPQTHRPTAAAKATSTTPERTAAPHLVPRTNPTHAVPPAAAHNVSAGSNVRSSKPPASDHTASKVNQTEVPALPTTHQTRPPHIATRPAPSRTSPWKGVKLSTKNDNQASAGDKGEATRRVLPESRPPAQEEPAINLKEAPRNAVGAGSEPALPPPGDKSGLVAALVFGMLFLMVVIGLVSRKVSEARRRHRYTKLDYLINGMYVDT
ncbi:MANSC domain-containing protein 1 [Phyllobates terribilis]|uniref:MANSC domain-containing protein 1 n=1 Tax=Phyllobates terribilis TaxID=111132 RepID=UPI003CCB6A9C